MNTLKHTSAQFLSQIQLVPNSFLESRRIASLRYKAPCRILRIRQPSITVQRTTLRQYLYQFDLINQRSSNRLTIDPDTMANPLDTDAGSELFTNYEAELKLVQADLNQKLDQAEELSGEERKSAIRGAQRALDEAKELVCPSNIISYPRWRNLDGHCRT